MKYPPVRCVDGQQTYTMMLIDDAQGYYALTKLVKALAFSLMCAGGSGLNSPEQTSLTLASVPPQQVK